MTFMTPQLLDEARAEIGSKSHQRIEYETASKWACRAIAAYELFLRTNELAWYRASIEFQHEAIEHAASAGPGMADAMTTELEYAILQVRR